MGMQLQSGSDHSIALHSGAYVERYASKPINRMQGLVRRMQLTKDTRIADFACGNGMLLQAIGRKFKSYDGVDFSQDFIDAAKEWAIRTNRTDYQFHCCDIRQFCAEHPHSFDIAATLDFSEHIEDSLAIDIYSSIKNSLTEGGVLYIHTPNLDFFMERAKEIGFIKQFPEHIAVRNIPDTVNILVKSGFKFENLKIKTIPHYNILKYIHPLSHLPLIGKFFAARLWIEAKASNL